MRLYCGIDLHSTNLYLVILDAVDGMVYGKRLPNDLAVVLAALGPYRRHLVGIAVESTYNWYWLVDGLMDVGYTVHLANPSALVQYNGLKYSDDRSDARWLAHLLRLGILPEGYIYPRELRGLRDLLRRRGRLVQQRTSVLVSLQNQFHRQTGRRLPARTLRGLETEEFVQQLTDPNVGLAAMATWRVLQSIDAEVQLLETEVLRQLKPDPLTTSLKTVAGLGAILAPTVRLETGEIRRFRSPSKYVSYCRAVGSKRISNGKGKGKGNTKNGNPHLAWAFVEAAHYAVRFYPPVRRFYERKKAQTCQVVAIKAVAHKLARASYYVMRDQVPFRIEMAFG